MIFEKEHEYRGELKKEVCRKEGGRDGKEMVEKKRTVRKERKR